MLDLFYNLTVEDICSKRLMFIKPFTTLNTARKLFADEDIKELIIGDETDILGIITMKDIIQTPCMLDSKCGAKSVIDFFKRRVITIDAGIRAEIARDLMRRDNIGRLPVIKHSRIIGMLRLSNIVNKFYPHIESIRDNYNYIFNHIHEGICVVDKDKIVRVWSKKAVELYKIEQKDIIGKSIIDFFPTPLLGQVVDTQKKIENVIHSPREGTYINISAVPLYQNGTLAGAVSTERDITELSKKTEALKLANQKLDMLTDEINRIAEVAYSFNTIIGESDSLKKTKQIASRAAKSNSSIIIKGDSGTGKELFARAIHAASGREGVFVPINCSAIPEQLFESEMFGYVGGAFSGALSSGKIGKMELADGGTLFLDELADMPFTMQSKMLRAIQNKSIVRVGDNKEIETDFRIICASHENLAEHVRQGKFRADLYYRLNVVQLNIPSLVERREDIPILINFLIKKICDENNRPTIAIAPKVVDVLTSYNWPGNVRELHNVIENLVIFSKDKITVEGIPAHIIGQRQSAVVHREGLNKATGSVERQMIVDALSKAEGNKAKAARILGISRPSLYYKIEKFNISVS